MQLYKSCFLSSRLKSSKSLRKGGTIQTIIFKFLFSFCPIIHKYILPQFFSSNKFFYIIFIFIFTFKKKNDKKIKLGCKISENCTEIANGKISISSTQPWV